MAPFGYAEYLLLVEVVEKIQLGLELVLVVLREHLDDRALLGLGGVALIHLLVIRIKC